MTEHKINKTYQQINARSKRRLLYENFPTPYFVIRATRKQPIEFDSIRIELYV